MDLEGVSGPGDSGGPAFIETENELALAGISSGQDGKGLNPGAYGVREYYARVSAAAGWIKKVKIIKDNGFSLSLSEMISREDCPLSKGIKNNLTALKIIRDEVEHKILRKGDISWFGIFQSCCLNFDKVICELFGENLTLKHELSFSLQFVKPDFDQLKTLSDYDLPPVLGAIDKKLNEAITKEEQQDLEYQFNIIYTMVNASKSQPHIKFVHPDSEEGKNIKNVLIKHQLADHVYPHKRNAVLKLVKEKLEIPFTSHNHTQAMYLHKVRPKPGSTQPENTNKQYCVYHTTHGDYTYSDDWVEFLVNQANDEEAFKKIKSYSW